MRPRSGSELLDPSTHAQCVAQVGHRHTVHICAHYEDDGSQLTGCRHLRVYLFLGIFLHSESGPTQIDHINVLACS